MNLLSYLIIAILLFWSPPGFARTEILNLRHWAAPDHTRVVIDTDNEVPFNVEKTTRLVVLTLRDAVLNDQLPQEFVLSKPGVRKVAFTPLQTGDMKIEFFLDRDVDTNVFKLKKFQDKPDRVVVDIIFPEVEKEKSVAREKVKVLKKDKIIVIDPGHGGEDPGARGRRGTNEKDVVLEISKKLRDVLTAGGGIQAFLTREEDYYVSFKERLGIARELGADLFISVHADAARNRRASGSSVYSLSTSGASSEAAKILARKENMADIIGGTPGEDRQSIESDPIILDMLQNNTINKSKTFGANILGKLEKINDIKFRSVQEAPFRVLKLPEIPAVLIETAYISNPREEQNLTDGKFQSRIAHTIAGSVREFFSLPVVNIKRRAVERSKVNIKAGRPEALPEPVATTYTVQKGDTLYGIARMNHKEIGELLKLNKMKLDDPLFVGRVLTLSKAKPERSTPLTHKVKKGETLNKIATKYGTNIATLLKLNHMKLDDPLHVERELRVPGK